MSNAERAVELRGEKVRFWGLGIRVCLDGDKMGEVENGEEEEVEEESNSDLYFPVNPPPPPPPLPTNFEG